MSGNRCNNCGSCGPEPAPTSLPEIEYNSILGNFKLVFLVLTMMWLAMGAFSVALAIAASSHIVLAISAMGIGGLVTYLVLE